MGTWVRTLLALLAGLLLPAGGGAATPQERAVAGTLHLRALPSGPLPLEGEWGFAWQRFVDPRWERLPTTAFAPVPNNWNALRADGKPPGENGWGSYVLLVDCPVGQQMVVEAVGQRTASRLFINGQAVAAHGEPGPSPQASRAAVHSVTPVSRPFACPLRLTLHVSNFDHRGGGFVRPLIAGPPEVVDRGRVSRAIYASALLAAYVLTGLLSLVIFAVRPRERVTLVFGVCCLAMAVYADMTAERLFLRMLSPQVDWAVYMRVEYLAYVLAMGLFFVTLWMLFPADIHRRVVHIVFWVLGAEAAAVHVLPPAIYSYTAAPGAFAAVICGYCAYAMVRGSERTRIEARLLLAGTAIVVCAMLLDLFLILGLFRMEKGTYELHPAPIDLREVAARVLVDLHSYAESCGVTLHLQDTAATPVMARAEELLCYSILANLVRNAIEASHPGEQVTVTFGRGDPAAVSIHNPAGVPDPIAARFFDKYVTGRKSGGTGLGTHSARLMARAQDGDVGMRTGVEGTTLTLTLPASRELPVAVSASRAAEPADAAWLAAFPARTVLLVDDEFTRLVTRRALPSPPFAVETAANGQAAVEAMARRRPDYLLVDMEMPLRNGAETVRWLRAHEAAQGGPRCRVIMMSANDGEAAAQRARDAGVDRFLPKPVPREVLLAAMRELEEGGSIPPPRTAGAAPVVIDREWEETLPRFLARQREAVEAMAAALAGDDRGEIEHLAHRVHGALATMGLRDAAHQARAIQRAAGAAASYGVSLAATYAQAGGYAAKVLAGARPELLPVTAPTQFELAINLPAARELRIEVPAALLARADELVQ